MSRLQFPLVLGFVLAFVSFEPLVARAVDHPRNTPMPAFSEEREAAALHFIKKHGAELLPILERLKIADAKKYQTEICEIFQVSEWLTDMRAEDEKRYALELDVWKTETRSLILVAKLAGLKEEERDAHKAEISEVAAKLVDLDMQIMRLRIEQLEKELGEARDGMARMDEQRESLVKDRASRLIEEAKKRGMMK
jgi:hypothetical protein